MKVYHGTNLNSANFMKGPPAKIDVSRGGGELGQGFYAGENIALAVSFSKGKFGSGGKVLKIKIDDSDFAQLNVRTLNSRQYVFRKWRSYLKRNISNTHKFNVDVICAPFATISFSYQYKFESMSSQNTLNNSKIKIL